MEPPTTPRRPRRTQTEENPTNAKAEGKPPEERAKPKSTRSSTTRSKLTTSTRSAAPISADSQTAPAPPGNIETEGTIPSTATSESVSGPSPADIASTVESPTGDTSRAESTAALPTASTMDTAALRETTDSALPPPPEPVSSTAPAVGVPHREEPSSPDASKPTQETISYPSEQAARAMSLTRILLSRNVQIGRRTLANANSAARTQVVRLAKPISAAQERVGQFTQRSREAVNRNLDAYQKNLETNDMTVIMSTIILIAAIVVLTLLVASLLR